MPNDSSHVRIVGLHKRFARDGVSQQVLDDISIGLGEGELVTLLGPSGCGKTTTLRCVAGLEQPDRGSIWVRGGLVFDSSDGTFVPPEGRRIGMAFQSYALWPHMKILENVEYPLRMQRVGRSERQRRAGEALERVGLGGKLNRYPRELSGGEQQRVALARATVGNPDVLLLDEPLSNLDAQLRQQTLVWLVELLRELNITTIYVTHDQAEALAISDRIIVMRGGIVLQDGSPREIYEHPANSFVAQFVGAANLLRCRVISGENGTCTVQPSLGGRSYLAQSPPESGVPKPGADVAIVVRPELVDVSALDAASGDVLAVVELRVYSGSGWEYRMRVGDHHLRVRTGAAPVLDVGDKAWLNFGGSPLAAVHDLPESVIG